MVRTTLDPQRAGDCRIAADRAAGRPGAAAGVTQGAVVVLDAATGAVRAMVGGRDYRQSSFNRAVLARRQPGSAFKPFVWLAALEKGVQPDDTVLDAPIRIGNWSPADFERQYLGEITVEEALAQSINTSSVRLLLQAGGPRVVAGVAAAARHRRQAAERRFACTWHRGGRAAGTHVGLRRVLQWRRARHAVRDRGVACRRADRRGSACGAAAGDRTRHRRR